MKAISLEHVNSLMVVNSQVKVINTDWNSMHSGNTYIHSYGDRENDGRPVIVGVVDLLGCYGLEAIRALVRDTESDHKLAPGFPAHIYSGDPDAVGPYFWPVVDACMIDPFIVARGGPGLWEYNAEPPRFRLNRGG